MPSDRLDSVDEPPNDLDIPKLDVTGRRICWSLRELVPMTHDQWLLDRVSTRLQALDGTGRAEWFAELCATRSLAGENCHSRLENHQLARRGVPRQEGSPNGKGWHTKNKANGTESSYDQDPRIRGD